MIKELQAQLMLFRHELPIKPKSDINSRASHCQQYFDFYKLFSRTHTFDAIIKLVKSSPSRFCIILSSFYHVFSSQMFVNGRSEGY